MGWSIQNLDEFCNSLETVFEMIIGVQHPKLLWGKVMQILNYIFELMFQVYSKTSHFHIVHASTLYQPCGLLNFMQI